MAPLRGALGFMAPLRGALDGRVKPGHGDAGV